MNRKILSIACLSLLGLLRPVPSGAVEPGGTPVLAAVEAADREFLAALESGAPVSSVPALEEEAPTRPAPAPVVKETRPPKAVANKSSNEVNREKAPKKAVTAKAKAPAPKAPKVKRTTSAPDTDVVEVRRALPVETRTVVMTTVTRHDREDDDDDEDRDEDEDREEDNDRDDGFLSRLFSR